MKIPIDRILIDHSLNVSRGCLPVSRESCEGLASSIDQHGMFTPVCVRLISDRPDYDYQLILGYRRVVAHGILGSKEIECFVREKDCTESKSKKLNVIENLLRLNPPYWEECCGLRDAFDPEDGDTKIARELNASRTWVRNRWLVWKMPPDVIAQVEAGLLSAAQVSLLIHKSYEEQQAAAARIRRGVEEGETTQQMEAALSNRRSVKPKKQVQAMMTQLMADGYEKEMHTLRWAIGEITDTQLMGFIT